MVGHVVLSADRPASTSGCCVETAPAGVEAGAGAVPTVGDRGSGWLESGPAGTGDNSSTLVSAAGLEPVTAVVLVGTPLGGCCWAPARVAGIEISTGERLSVTATRNGVGRRLA